MEQLRVVPIWINGTSTRSLLHQRNRMDILLLHHDVRVIRTYVVRSIVAHARFPLCTRVFTYTRIFIPFARLLHVHILRARASDVILFVVRCYRRNTNVHFLSRDTYREQRPTVLGRKKRRGSAK